VGVSFPLIPASYDLPWVWPPRPTPGLICKSRA